jgi:hypothetical protein
MLFNEYIEYDKFEITREESSLKLVLVVHVVFCST